MLLAFGIIISSVSLTGAAIKNVFSGSNGLTAVILFLIGLVLISGRERNYAREILDQRKYVEDTRELKKIARQMGYELIEGYKEGTRVYNGKEVVTVIPNHRKISGRGVVRGILESLAMGESSFRKAG